MTTGVDIVRAARELLGTPYHHMGRLPGVGIDCAGVWICIGRSLSLVPPDFDVPPYTMQPDGKSLLLWCNQHMGARVPLSALEPGLGILLKGAVYPQHLGVLGDYLHGGLSIIHSASNAQPPRVIETRLMLGPSVQLIAAYRFPGVV